MQGESETDSEREGEERGRERQRQSVRSSRSALGDSSTPAGPKKKSRQDGDPTRSVQGGGGKNTWEDSQVTT